MGDKVNVELVRILESFMATYDESLEYDPVTGEALMTRQAFRKAVIETLALPQSVTLADKVEATDDDIVLHSYEDCLKNPMMHAENFRHIEEESNRMHASRLIQKTGDAYVVVNPPYPPLTTEEMDYSFDLPYTRLPHPKYNGKRIPAFDMIKFSVNMHRGCFDNRKRNKSDSGHTHYQKDSGEHGQHGHAPDVRFRLFHSMSSCCRSA
jgi:hypothetical protein